MFFKRYKQKNNAIYMIKLGMETQKGQFHHRSENSNASEKQTLVALERCLNYWINEINEAMGWSDPEMKDG